MNGSVYGVGEHMNMKTSPIEKLPNGSTALANVSCLRDIVCSSIGVPNTSQRLAKSLNRYGIELVFHGQYDSAKQQATRTFLSELPAELTVICTGFDATVGCPIVRKAVETLCDFDAIQADFSKHHDFLSKRYLGEIKKLPFDQLAVVPVKLDNWVHVFFLGLNEIDYSGLARRQICCAIGSYVAALSIHFEDHEMEGEGIFSKKTKKLKKREKECLIWSARGKTSSEIATILGLSEHTINHYINFTTKKMGAVNKVQAVSFAICSGELKSKDIFRNIDQSY